MFKQGLSPLSAITSHLEIRPVYVYHPTRVRAHVFLCLLALHVQWHLRRQLSPLLFEDERPDEVREQGASPVEKARVSESAQCKAAGRKTEEGLPVSSLGTLLGHLSTLTLNEVVMPTQPNRPLTLVAKATPLQRRAFELLDVNPNPGPNVAISGTP